MVSSFRYRRNILLIVFSFLWGCSTPPTQEALDLAPRIQNDHLQSYLEFIANELHKVSSEEIFVSAYETPIVQAWNTSGNISISSGMLAMIEDESELAGLLAHELAHTALNHDEKEFKNDSTASSAAKVFEEVFPSLNISKTQETIAKGKWNQKKETEADLFVVRLISKTHFDVYGLPRLMERLANARQKFSGLSVGDSHRDLNDRAKILIEVIQKENLSRESKRTHKDLNLRGSEVFRLSYQAVVSEIFSEASLNDLDPQQTKIIQRINEIQFLTTGWKTKKPSFKVWFAILEELSSITRENKLPVQKLYRVFLDHPFFFMKERIEAKISSRFNFKTAAASKIAQILSDLSKMGIGSIPIVGDAVDFYEVFVGEDFYSGKKLSKEKRKAAALGLLSGNKELWDKALKILKDKKSLPKRVRKQDKEIEEIFKKAKKQKIKVQDPEKDKKIYTQMPDRNWTKKDIYETVYSPHETRRSKNKENGNPATVYYRKDGHYVVVDDKLGKVIQISDRKDRNWLPDSKIEEPYFPEDRK